MTHTLIFYLARIADADWTMLIATDDQDRSARARLGQPCRTHASACSTATTGKAPRAWPKGRTTGPVADKLKAYFEGDIAAIEDIATETAGTPFQREVWAALREIPAGETWSYGRLAATYRPAGRRARRGPRQRRQSHRGRGALPPRDRRRRQPDRLWRRPRAQEVAARARRRRFSRKRDPCQSPTVRTCFPTRCMRRRKQALVGSRRGRPSPRNRFPPTATISSSGRRPSRRRRDPAPPRRCRTCRGCGRSPPPPPPAWPRRWSTRSAGSASRGSAKSEIADAEQAECRAVGLARRGVRRRC